MKFSYKILLCCMITVAVAFGIGGYVFVNDVFQASLKRETGQAMDESSILQFAFETAALNIPSKYDMLQNSVIEEIGANLEKSGQVTGRLLRISDENRQVLYASQGFGEDTRLLEQIQEGIRAYQIIHPDERYYIQTGSQIKALDRILYLETLRDVSGVYGERARGFAVYRNLTLLLLVLSSIFLFFISSWLTRPIRLLTQAARQMTEGDYSCRAEQISSDEMGQLTCDFNHMASVLEENIRKLENEVRAREDFIAAFSHELKTPLTAVIGYADLLRTRKLDEEKHFLSANYIYTEGKRLEAMSLRLLDIIVTKRCSIDAQDTQVEVLFSYLKEMYGENQEHPLKISFEPGQIRGEVNLLKSVLLNLVDNAFKASEEGSPVEVTGAVKEHGYEFSVRDYGVGISQSECKKITEAFYMVDKSRSRSHNGAGLGLALCVEILKLHGSQLEIESALGQGSCFHFQIPGSWLQS
ncbi:MAG: HAMP domain-containing histidine kinase [Lachnospiraceae bacterium]|jgi:signal transduction histidine kinase|nr:HAMP domain-containing histidine kinase [Lachnospiraceae bacterium]MCI8997040.1 HAMP domain-containing histidine kinase [Lachnospiraceae bacterium]MCI9135228.1 HAMP domain-containing histidine kinase [Lachnospiraceae bacterium]